MNDNEAGVKELRNEDDQSPTRIGPPSLPPGVGHVENVDDEQIAQVKAMLTAQEEAASIQLRAVQAQTVHMLSLALRILTGNDNVPKADRTRLAAKIILAIDLLLGSGPSENEEKPKPGFKKNKRRGMGFGAS